MMEGANQFKFRSAPKVSRVKDSFVLSDQEDIEARLFTGFIEYESVICTF